VPTTAAGTPDTKICRDLKGIGACWALITEKHRFILFGTYPYDQHWRPLICIFLFNRALRRQYLPPVLELADWARSGSAG
jgi:hypothetical protein